jgi:hypothetical protein
MEQNSNFTGGSAASQVDPQELETASQSVVKQAAGNGTPVVSAFSQLQARRAERLSAAAKALRDKFGEKDPDAAAVAALAGSAADLKVQLEIQTARAKRWPKPRANEWVVFGTVWDKKGVPAPGLTVRVFDKDRKYDDLLGETETDENGDFAVVYHERDFKETRENLPELYVMVLDVSGKVLYSSQDSVRFGAGRSEYFAIHLGAGRAQKSRTQAAKKPGASAAGRRSDPVG